MDNTNQVPQDSKNNKLTLKRFTAWIPLVFFLMLFMFDRLFGNAIAHNTLSFNIVIGVAWILMLLNTIWLFRSENQKYSTAIRIAFVFMLTVLFLWISAHYLGFF
jgi:Mn2+/Fe2+ NRAMP family transporter